MKKKLICLATVIVLLCSMAGTAAFADGVISVRTIADLDNVRSDLTASYRLDADIIFDGTQTFVPIAAEKLTEPGAECEEFTGTFDGNGHFIKNLRIVVNCADENTMPFAGFFGTVKGTVKDLELRNVSVTFTTDLTGMEVIMQEAYVGGIAARNKGTISGCEVSSGTVSATAIGASRMDIGGICGGNFKNVVNCLNRASVSGEGNTSSWIASGGIVGYQGHNHSTTFGNVVTSVNFGTLSATTTHETKTNLYTAGIAAYNYGPITDSYYANTAPMGAFNKTTKYTKDNTLTEFDPADDGNSATFPALDFDSVWFITNGKLALHEENVPDLFTLNAPTPQFTADGSLFNVYCEADVSATAALETETSDVKVLAYGVLYGANTDDMAAFITAVQSSGSTDGLKVVRYTYDSSEMGLTRMYGKYSYRFRGVKPGKTRCVAAFVRYEYAGEIFEEFSTVSSAVAA